ncbi:hypothetical protein NE237_016340 [Protea cynaroides]|uniref:Uncharacterized protein n=1 Tax=Protea cynaroides TaxID=273540 RepID=A0A9Q0GN66_9MAGN|nr:hypothetical protein NE237_016340 [Protea cynaroides]
MTLLTVSFDHFEPLQPRISPLLHLHLHLRLLCFGFHLHLRTAFAETFFLATRSHRIAFQEESSAPLQEKNSIIKWTFHPFIFQSKRIHTVLLWCRVLTFLVASQFLRIMTFYCWQVHFIF